MQRTMLTVARLRFAPATPRTAPSTAAKATGNIDSSPPTTPRFSSLTSPRQHAENLKSQAEAVARGAAVAATTGPVFQPREWTLLGFADIHHVDQDLALRVSANGSPTMHRIAVALTDPGVMDAYALSFVQASCLGQLVEKWREHRGEETAESKLSARRRLAHYMRDVMVMDMDEARRPQSLS